MSRPARSVHPLRTLKPLGVSRYMPTHTGLSALRQSLLLALGLAREDQLPGPRYKPEGFRFEEVVRTSVGKCSRRGAHDTDCGICGPCGGTIRVQSNSSRRATRRSRGWRRRCMEDLWRDCTPLEGCPWGGALSAVGVDYGASNPAGRMSRPQLRFMEAKAEGERGTPGWAESRHKKFVDTRVCPRRVANAGPINVRLSSPRPLVVQALQRALPFPALLQP